MACICLAHDATFLTRNVADFKPVPGLRVENWLDVTKTYYPKHENENLRNRRFW